MMSGVHAREYHHTSSVDATSVAGDGAWPMRAPSVALLSSAGAAVVAMMQELHNEGIWSTDMVVVFVALIGSAVFVEWLSWVWVPKKSHVTKRCALDNQSPRSCCDVSDVCRRRASRLSASPCAVTIM